MIHIKSRGRALAACRRFTAPLLLGLGALAAAPVPAQDAPARAAAEGRPQQLPTVQLNAGMHLIRAMVAQAPLERQIGLMYRREMAPNDGMLFIFEDRSQQCFWMKNTLLPLSAAFVADDGTVVNIADMQPLSEASHCSAKPVRYVLEMHQGWFAKRGIQAGSKLGGSPFR
ncbi:DUF192 domain-containing protein [Piscinibacter sakaiensis]|uniref:Exported protein n=1 Tax=Piscinibacter sakaiensis TaxID=1547922 RepID=A0A0K8NTW2_PISS1|nr:DUF192 domain-containing protein [Piscinibacter sakaiensis]GAP33689.1 exported protein [Piscinibacter sakaiensis]